MAGYNPYHRQYHRGAKKGGKAVKKRHARKKHSSRHGKKPKGGLLGLYSAGLATAVAGKEFGWW